jgi:hypothetical protein
MQKQSDPAVDKSGVCLHVDSTHGSLLCSFAANVWFSPHSVMSNSNLGAIASTHVVSHDTRQRLGYPTLI